MGDTRTTKIHRGFHRVGIVAAVLAAVLPLIFTIDAHASDRMAWAMGTAAVAVITYVLCRALGWIIAGFVGE